MYGLRDDFEGVKHWRLTAPKGRIIYDEGEPISTFYRVDQGCVRLQVNREDGRRQILAFLFPGDVFGVESEVVRRAAAEAVTRVELTCFQGSGSGGVCSADAAAGLAHAACEMATALATHLMGLCHTGAERRVRWFLDWAATRQGRDPVGGRLDLPMSRRDIADFLGLTPETLSRTFGRLEALGEIRVLSARRLVLRPRDGGPGALRAA